MNHYLFNNHEYTIMNKKEWSRYDKLNRLEQELWEAQQNKGRGCIWWLIPVGAAVLQLFL